MNKIETNNLRNETNKKFNANYNQIELRNYVKSLLTDGEIKTYNKLHTSEVINDIKKFNCICNDNAKKFLAKIIVSLRQSNLLDSSELALNLYAVRFYNFKNNSIQKNIELILNTVEEETRFLISNTF